MNGEVVNLNVVTCPGPLHTRDEGKIEVVSSENDSAPLDSNSKTISWIQAVIFSSNVLHISSLRASFQMSSSIRLF